MRLQVSKFVKMAKGTLIGAVAMALAVCLGPMGASAARTPIKSTPSAHSTTKHRRVRYRRYRHHITLPKAPSKDRTEEIQSALGRGGYYRTEPTGKWDMRTQEALREFQEANGLPPTGKLDALSLQKMGLGSDVAGVSAPRPSTTPSRLASSSASATKSPGR